MNLDQLIAGVAEKRAAVKEEGWLRRWWPWLLGALVTLLVVLYVASLRAENSKLATEALLVEQTAKQKAHEATLEANAAKRAKLEEKAESLLAEELKLRRVLRDSEKRSDTLVASLDKVSSWDELEVVSR